MWDRAYYRDKVFYVHPEVYEPREDSFLLADNLQINPGELVLDMGTGCGIQGLLAAKTAKKVVAIDINPYSEWNFRVNSSLHKAMDKTEFRLGNLFEPIRAEEKFDLVLFNPPYLPVKEKPKSWVDYSYNSSEVLRRFLTEYKNCLKPNGRCLIVNSSLSKVKVQGEEIASKKLHFEKISVIAL